MMLVLGVGAAVIGSGYKVGTLARMGPGFMPVILGVALAFMGLLIAGTALVSSEPDDTKFMPDNPQWFGWFCILAGPVLFIIPVSYTHLRAHETGRNLVCRLLLDTKKH